MTAILLIPLKLIVKAAAYILAAVLGTAAIIIAIASALHQRITSFIGGIAIIGALLIAALNAADTHTVLTAAGMGIALILIPVIIGNFSKLINTLRERVLAGAADIELI